MTQWFVKMDYLGMEGWVAGEGRETLALSAALPGYGMVMWKTVWLYRYVEMLV